MQWVSSVQSSRLDLSLDFGLQLIQEIFWIPVGDRYVSTTHQLNNGLLSMLENSVDTKSTNIKDL